MKQLILLRHARAAAGSTAADHARPLDGRGRAGADWTAARFASQPPPDLVLCSTSVRTRQTLDLVSAVWDRQPTVHYENGLYLAEPQVLMQHIMAIESRIGSVMLVGHNPGLHELALHLSRELAAPPALAALRAHFPPAARAVFAIDTDRWSDLENAPITLENFTVPPAAD